ncbi:3'-5' exonuclease [Acinetobacter modestus]|uniref:3'-5' exonuclease n=1 Tax=Acinetobacter modestus TaxID=1776740 RepID=UPI00202F52D4|nr:3'-5' exonuclease [Acinetobacter modestus]MCM1959345.1 3'-5' exonuclease [Acinetobacter modestus]
MQAIILDTETHTLNGLPIEIAYAPIEIERGKLSLDKKKIFDQLYQVGQQPISYAAMAVHHILESDLADQPFYSEFRLPEQTQYIIGHNVDYDITAIAKCGVDTSKIKPICTLALARRVWENAEAHNISALIYLISKGSDKAREMLKGAHRADADIILTANILMHIIHQLNIENIEQLYIASEEARIPKSITFGKHKGTAIQDLPADYIQWLLRQDDLDLYLRKALETKLVR